jgi:hypothetical protein
MGQTRRSNVRAIALANDGNWPIAVSRDGDTYFDTCEQAIGCTQTKAARWLSAKRPFKGRFAGLQINNLE